MLALVERIRAFVLAVARRLAWLPPTLARVSVGWVFVITGWGKLHHLPKVVAFFQSLGIPAAHLQAPMVATFELACGVAILLGLFTRLAAMPLTVVMIVAIGTAKWSSVGDASDLFGLQEYLFIVVFLWLAAAGPGPLSVDAILDKWWRRRGAVGAGGESGGTQGGAEAA